MDDFSHKLEIAASTDASDYLVSDTEFWPPPPPPALTPEEQARIEEFMRGAACLIVLPCWIFHKNDVDPWPSMLHGHHNQKPLKLDAITGFIYRIQNRKHVQTLRPKALLPIQMKLISSKDFSERAYSLINLEQTLRASGLS